VRELQNRSNDFEHCTKCKSKIQGMRFMHQTPLFFSQLFGRRKPETESNSEERETGSNGIKLAFWAEF